MKKKAFDFVIIGAGITGLSLARTIKKQITGATLLVIEKENKLGEHGSGRNSGVLHSGIYYPEDSLKAKLCSGGAKAMANYCHEYDLPIARLGKVIVPTTIENDFQLDVLSKRAVSNGATVEMLDQQQLKEIEPEAHSATGRALYSPNTSVVDPKAILNKLLEQLRQSGVVFYFGSKIKSIRPDESLLEIDHAQIKYGELLNSAGQYADVVAKLCDVGRRYTLLPFKGIYYKLRAGAELSINGLIYPVPDMNLPFLGVHSVKSINGDVYFGPTAVPALGREHYKGIKGINVGDASSIIYHLIRQYVKDNQNFRSFAKEEAWRSMKKYFIEAVQLLTPNVKSSDLISSEKVGIRAQLLDKKTKEMVMDFITERKDNTTHVLNAVSPAFTSAFAFSEYIVSYYNLK